jgi:hypothetical protein
MSHSDDPPPPSELPTRGGLGPGLRVFGRFVLRRVLGRGGMGVVWEAEDERLAETVALKFLPDPLGWDAAALDGLRRETQRARTLAHPNIVRVYDLHEGSDGAAIAMERIHGRTLSAWRLEQPGGVASPEAIRPWLPALCQALDYAHREAGVVHRDLKPANVMLTQEGRVKVADFGIACVAAESLARTSTVWSGGTLPYMSPQQLWGEAAAVADDVYALGAVLFEMLVGEPPFMRGHLHAQIERRVPPRVNVARRARVPGAAPVPTAWEETVARCLAKDPAHRPPSAAAVADAIVGNRPLASRRADSRVRLSILAVTAAALALPVAWLHWPEQALTPPLAGPGPRAAPDVRDSPRASGYPLPIVFGALAQRLAAHLPLDGDLRVFGGQRGEANGGALEWTADRFGRPRGALQFHGAGGVALPIDGKMSADGTEPWTLSCWVRSESQGGMIVGLIPEVSGAPYLSLAVGRAVLHAATGPYTSDASLVYDREPLEPRWEHVAATLERGRLTLWRNGRAVGTEALRVSSPRMSRFRLEVGAVTGGSLGRWRGALDDVRVYSAALGPEAIASLAAEDAPPGDAWVASELWMYPWRRSDGRALALTLGAHADTEDGSVAVRREFGAGARVADWADLAAAAGPWPELLAETLGWVQNEAVYLTRGGARTLEVIFPRSYYAIRTTGVVSTTFLQHARIGANEICLGSWPGQTLPILAEAPAERIHRVVRWATAQPLPDAWRAAPGELRVAVAVDRDRRGWIAVASLPELGRLREGVGWELADDDGGVWRVTWAPTVPGVWGLEIVRTAGEGDAVPKARYEEATGMQPLDLVVVVSRGRCYAAVVDPVASRWIGSVVSRDIALDPRRAWTATLRGPGLGGPPATAVEWVEFPGRAGLGGSRSGRATGPVGRVSGACD